jgi:lipopolysaccharide/colanic/teichoic acid biosynthesis glycosyltransferase
MILIKIFKRVILFFEYCYNRSIVLADATFGDLIKLESKGQFFFRQGRPGIDEKSFIATSFDP